MDYIELPKQIERATVDKAYSERANENVLIKSLKGPWEDFVGKELWASGFEVSEQTTFTMPLIDKKPVKIIIDEELLNEIDNAYSDETRARIIKKYMRVQNDKGRFVKSGAFALVRNCYYHIKIFETEEQAWEYYFASKAYYIKSELQKVERILKETVDTVNLRDELGI